MTAMKLLEFDDLVAKAIEASLRYHGAVQQLLGGGVLADGDLEGARLEALASLVRVIRAAGKPIDGIEAALPYGERI